MRKSGTSPASLPHDLALGDSVDVGADAIDAPNPDVIVLDLGRQDVLDKARTDRANINIGCDTSTTDRYTT